MMVWGGPTHLSRAAIFVALVSLAAIQSPPMRAGASHPSTRSASTLSRPSDPMAKAAATPLRHRWDVTPAEARQIQEQVRSRVSRKNGRELRRVRYVAGV